MRKIAQRATANEPDLCSACHWSPTDVCIRCGEHDSCFGVRTGEPVCLRCQALERLATIIAQADGTPHPRLAGLLDLFGATPNARSLLSWLHSSPSVTLLEQLARGEIELSHEALDGRDQTPSLRHARSLLVSIGTLPNRDPHLSDLEYSLKRLIDNAPEQHRSFLRSFTRWAVLNRIRRKHTDRPVGAHVAKNARTHVSEAARFLIWLDTRGTSLDQASQGDTDRYLSERPHSRRAVRAVLEHRGSNIEVRILPRNMAPRPADQPLRWNLAKRLLHDQEIDPADRVAGCLVLLYAQPVSRIVTLSLNDVVIGEDDTHLTLHREPVLIPEPLGSLVQVLPAPRQIGPSGTATTSERWLFPGRNAGRHLHPEHLRTRLKKLGIDCRANRNAALLQLAAELPPVVVGSLLGIHATTAVRWSHAAGADWSRYAARRLPTPGY